MARLLLEDLLEVGTAEAAVVGDGLVGPLRMLVQHTRSDSCSSGCRSLDFRLPLFQEVRRHHTEIL